MPSALLVDGDVDRQAHSPPPHSTVVIRLKEPVVSLRSDPADLVL